MLAYVVCQLDDLQSSVQIVSGRRVNCSSETNIRLSRVMNFDQSEALWKFTISIVVAVVKPGRVEQERLGPRQRRRRDLGYVPHPNLTLTI